MPRKMTQKEIEELEVVFKENATDCSDQNETETETVNARTQTAMAQFVQLLRRRMVEMGEKITLYEHAVKRFSQAIEDELCGKDTADLQKNLLALYAPVFLLNLQFEKRGKLSKETPSLTSLDKLDKDVRAAKKLKKLVDDEHYDTIKELYTKRVKTYGNLGVVSKELDQTAIKAALDEFLIGINDQIYDCNTRMRKIMEELPDDGIKTLRDFEGKVYPLLKMLGTLGPYDDFKKYDAVSFEHSRASEKNNRKMPQFLEKTLNGMDEKIYDWERVETTGKILDLRNGLYNAPHMKEYARLITWKFNLKNYMSFAKKYAFDAEKTRVFTDKKTLQVARKPPKFTVGD